MIKKLFALILNLEASLYLRRTNAKVIAITGSVGKSTTKEFVAGVLASKRVRKSHKSYNSEFGVPLTILGYKNPSRDPLRWIYVLTCGLMKSIFFKLNYDYLVLEIGVDRKGDMEYLTKYIKPNISIITAYPKNPVHGEFFNSDEELYREKSFLIEVTKDIVIYNRDDEMVCKYVEKYGSKKRKISFGFKDSDIQCVLVKNNEIRIKVFNKQKEFKFNTLISDGFIYSFLSALAVAHIEWIEVGNTDIFKKLPGRGLLLTGINNSLILEGSYNASPASVQDSFRTLSRLPGRKIILLGDMAEISDEEKVHRDILLKASEIAEIVIVVGKIMKKTIEKYNLDYKHFSNSTDAGNYLKGVIKDEDTILIKGSQVTRMERASKILLDPKESVKASLPRQDKEWV